MSLLEVEDLCKNFGGLEAVKNLTFDIHRGEIFGLIGPNGSGKTTTFNLITGFYRPKSGSVKFKGEQITGLKPHAIVRRGIGRTFQLSKPLSGLTALENVATGAFLKDKNVRRAKKKAKEILRFIGMAKKEGVLAGSLNAVDRKFLELGRALALEPELLLIDEIVAGLNPTEAEETTSLLMKIREQGTTLMVIEHVMQSIMTLSDRILVIDYGKRIAEGTPQEVAENPRVIEAYLGKEYVG